MNSEYVLDSAKTILTANLATQIAVIEAENASTVIAPTPAIFLVGKLDPTVLAEFPSVQVIMKNSSFKNDQYLWQDRVARLEIVCWVTACDMQNLHRFVTRYGDGVVRCLRKESNWANSLHNPKVGDALYSDLFETEYGMAEGCLVNCEVEYIINS